MNKEELKQILNEIFEDEIYDIVDAFPQEYICDVLCKEEVSLNTKDVFQFSLGDYIFKVNNTVGGFVSCSDSDHTTVSETLYLPFPNDGEHEPKEMWKNLIDMINEAWYACANY